MRDVRNLHALQRASAVQKSQGARAFSGLDDTYKLEGGTHSGGQKGLPPVASVKAGDRKDRPPLCAYRGRV